MRGRTKWLVGRRLVVGALALIALHGGCAAAAPQVVGAPAPEPPGAELDIGERHFFPLAAAQQRELRRLIRTDPEARALWHGLRDEAEPALARAPRPVERIHYEGLLDTDPRRVESVASLRDMPRLAVLGYAYAATGDRRYRDRARESILGWARTYRPDGNPINENKLEPVWLVYGMLRPHFAESERREVEGWMERIARAEIASGPGTWEPGARKNNWDTKRLKIVGGIGLVLGDDALVRTALDGFRLYTADALFPDGTSVDLHERDALRYHVSGLVPILVFAVLADQHAADPEAGRSLFRDAAPTGASVLRSVEYVLPYARGERSRAEWVGSTAPIDRRRAEAGLARYQPGVRYEPAHAAPMLGLASYFDPAYAPLVPRLLDTGAQRYPTWETLVLDVLRRAPSEWRITRVPR